jgi:hypothetical protein
MAPVFGKERPIHSGINAIITSIPFKGMVAMFDVNINYKAQNSFKFLDKSMKEHF